MSISLPAGNAQQQVAALHGIGQILGSTTQFEEALNAILKLICEQLSMSLGTVSLLSQEENEVAIDVLPKGYSNKAITEENVLDILTQISRPAKFDCEIIFAEPRDQLWNTVFGIEI